VVIAGTAMYSLVRANVFRTGCDYPLTYQIGEIDSEFGISTSTVRNLLTDAEQVWESKSKDELFRHNPGNGEIVIDFTYDQRQRRTETQNRLSENLSTLAESHDGLADSLESKRAEYRRLAARYEGARQQYENNLQSYNQRARELRGQSGVSSETRNQLNAERRDLEQVRSSLTETRNRLTSLQSEINRITGQANSLAEDYNTAADTFESRFGTTNEFSQATYKNEVITVYQYEEHDDLRLALAHEFGHALGITHVDDPEAIMYNLMDQQPLDPLNLTAADQKALRNTCRL
jgi:DNA repair exonuclease SbcCD ATPase subunit